MLRAFFNPDWQADPRPDQVLTLDPEESHHLARVLRARPGDAIEVLDGAGAVIRGEVLDGGGSRSLRLRVKSLQRETAPRPKALWQAIPKGKMLDQIIRAATELGMTGLVPLVSERSEVRLDPARAQSKQRHWQAIAREACKQSGNPWLPVISRPQSVAEALACRARNPSEGPLAIVASLQPGTQPLVNVLASHPPSAPLTLAVGPEGDFTPDEYRALNEAGFHPVSLAQRVLRCETAALYLLSVVDAVFRRTSSDGILDQKRLPESAKSG